MSFKNKIVAGCIFMMIIMTAFPPQIVRSYSTYSGNLLSERIEYHFIGGGNISYDEQSKIAFDRLLLQYAIVTGAGFMIFLLKSEKDKQ
jgi:hypothetical protein